MSTPSLGALALAGALLTYRLSAGIYADQVVQYDPGTGAVASMNNPQSALGEPSRVTPGQFGGPVDPFNPPFLGSQLVSIGAGGSLTLQFSTPILDRPGNPWGLDFLIFGNAGFVITNAFDPDTFTYVGTPATDGSLLGDHAQTRVSVSEDGLTFYALAPAQSPSVDALFPTDGAGDFQTPVNPSLAGDAFAGATLDTIRAQYAGSGGGAGYDLAAATDAQGQPAALGSARYVRIDVLSDKVEIDGIVMVPEPSPASLALVAFGGGLGLWAFRQGRRNRA